jgi:uncharacterized protein with FMN-binding domain
MLKCSSKKKKLSESKKNQNSPRSKKSKSCFKKKIKESFFFLSFSSFNDNTKLKIKTTIKSKSISNQFHLLQKKLFFHHDQKEKNLKDH